MIDYGALTVQADSSPYPGRRETLGMSRGERWVTCVVDERAHSTARYDLDAGRDRYRGMCTHYVLVGQVLPQSMCGTCARASAPAHAAWLDKLTCCAELTPAGRVR